MLHGTEDALVAWSCAQKQRDHVRTAWGLDAEEILVDGGDWGRIRYTPAAAAEEGGALGPGGPLLELLWHTWKAEGAGALVLGGHCYPGSPDKSGGAPGQLFGFGCEGTSSFHWGEEIVAFFLAHPLGPAE